MIPKQMETQCQLCSSWRSHAPVKSMSHPFVKSWNAARVEGTSGSPHGNNELSPSKTDITAMSSSFFQHWRIPFTRLKLARPSRFASCRSFESRFRKMTESPRGTCRAAWSMRGKIVALAIPIARRENAFAAMKLKSAESATSFLRPRSPNDFS